MLSVDYENFDLISYLYNLVRQIPDGMVSTYGDLAEALGDPVAARSVGFMLSINKEPDYIPCYKVVPHDGSVGNYTHPLGSAEKMRRLIRDGITITNGHISNFEKVRFREFKTDYPLRKLRELQFKIGRLYDDRNDYSLDTIAAFDVSYKETRGYASKVVYNKGKIGAYVYSSDSMFPYIPGYLAFKEFKFIRALYDNETMILIDGNGILHPRFAGLATHAGVSLKTASIGIAKHLINCTVKGSDLLISGVVAGKMIGHHTIVSPGNRINVEEAGRLIEQREGKEMRSLLRLAHNLTRLHIETNGNIARYDFSTRNTAIQSS
ncbi:hypothetical protein [Thermoplasma volcanium GSS1]|uniref:Bifunctional methyltransferase/endonuclease n=1 Tax=Thermoplasma volcanium (strain ATCC 51530 / DSM 4299 / JCM 9571 / NBRC 15438 / GSS1) TaxID=273116 RepID=NFI_THEVO|nr:endonuclease V [Thermoplasma volcanium]Q97AL5.1 RecName: Full=Bifunctional methyltransferase/endonuclease; Includes: RecName: Full=Probable methylated-DNA--protein-cysteine methyltransferase; AltName: Full=O-6-methylbase-DNA-alkyltransferase; Includes: RecName: Full=Endonuclease V; AltName: Full=Deoxyinosine 3'endonuclease; AltName: Full=Deoxyribonuclease V; Short=DNase V [Thermoplasma volcanium GSS1]BAB59937.1 hypothetical protein [Thermoplasma volcanium GSS1]